MGSQFGQYDTKVVLRLGEYGDVIETQIIEIVPQSFLANPIAGH